jgi:hypothetical protein
MHDGTCHGAPGIDGSVVSSNALHRASGADRSEVGVVS